jgi:hypothetical protein
MLQIWTGWFARTPPGYALWVLSPINLVPSPHYTMLSGVVATDRWFGPLFNNIILNTSVRNIKIDAQAAPFIQVLPIKREDFAPKRLDNFVVSDGIPADMWGDYYNTLIHPHEHIGEAGYDRPGHYAVSERRRAKQE